MGLWANSIHESALCRSRQDETLADRPRVADQSVRSCGTKACFAGADDLVGGPGVRGLVALRATQLDTPGQFVDRDGQWGGAGVAPAVPGDGDDVLR